MPTCPGQHIIWHPDQQAANRNSLATSRLRKPRPVGSCRGCQHSAGAVEEHSDWASDVQEYLVQDKGQSLEFEESLCCFAVSGEQLVSTIQHAPCDGWALAVMLHYFNDEHSAGRTDSHRPYKPSLRMCKILKYRNMSVSGLLSYKMLQSRPFQSYRSLSTSYLRMKLSLALSFPQRH